MVGDGAAVNAASYLYGNVTRRFPGFTRRTLAENYR